MTDGPTPRPKAALMHVMTGVMVCMLAGAALAQSPTELRDQPARDITCPQSGAAVAIEGVGRATYDRIEFDGLTQEATLSGSVCVELDGQDARLLTERLDLSELDAGERGERPTLEATEAVVDTREWRLLSGGLQGRSDDLTLRDVVVLGDRLVGRINEIELTPDARPASGIVLRTENYEISAASGRLSNDRIELNAAVVSPCRCDPPAIALQTGSIEATFDGDQALAVAPVLLLFGAGFELAERIDLREGNLDFEPPVDIRGDEDLGTTVGVDVISDAGRSIELGVTSEPNLRAFYSLSVRQDGTVVAFQQDALETTFRITGRSDLPQGRRLDHRFLLRFGDEPLTRVETNLTAPLARVDQAYGAGAGRAGLTADLTAGVGLAAEPATANVGPFGPRIPLAATLRPFWQPTANQTFEVRVRPYGVVYPATAAGGADAYGGLTVVPQWRYQDATQSWRVFYERQDVRGSSPFAFDEPETRRRVGVQAAVSGGGLSLNGRAVRRLEPETPGFEDLDVGLVARTNAGGWSLEGRASANLAGYYGGPSDERQRTFRVSAARPEGTAFSVGWARSLDPDDPARELRTSVRLPRGLQGAQHTWAGTVTWDEDFNLNTLRPEWTTDRTLGASTTLRVAGLVDVTSEGQLEAYGLSLARTDTQQGTRAQLGFEMRTSSATDPGLAVVAEWPISAQIGADRRLTVTPYIDVNASAWADGSGFRALNAHGLDVDLDGCCGNWYANYRYDQSEGGLEASLGLRLPALTFTGPPLDPLPAIPPRYGERP